MFVDGEKEKKSQGAFEKKKFLNNNNKKYVYVS